uniref:Uncharacterized protein n=1 Tax=Rhizophora mucronata TaxID=61149 RepID=A0A2P2MYJ1_RHIMU
MLSKFAKPTFSSFLLLSPL